MKEERNKTISWMNQISYYDPSRYNNEINYVMIFNIMISAGPANDRHLLYMYINIQLIVFVATALK